MRNELRIGNYVRLKVEVREYRLNIPVLWLPKKEGGEIGVNSFSLNDIEPIPLTPEILINAGFVYDEAKFTYSIRVGIYNKEDLVIEWRTVKAHWLRTVRGERISFWSDLEYVHQLQNLYFALTGEELPIKL